MSNYIDFHTHHATPTAEFIFSHSLGEGYPAPLTPYTAAIHPWAVKRVDIAAALELLRQVDIVAVGETGLDYKCNTDRFKQLEVFDLQLTIAAERNLPVVIHCVHAQDDIISVLSRFPIPRVAFHGYIGSIQQIAKLIELGYYVSFGEVSLESPKTIAAMKTMPLDRLFLETDASNTPIEQIYTHAAHVLNIDIKILKEQVYSNFKIFFE